MTNAELVEHIDSGKLMKVHCTADNFSLVVDGQHHVINEEQACILWDALPLLAAQSSAKPAST